MYQRGKNPQTLHATFDVGISSKFELEAETLPDFDFDCTVGIQCFSICFSSSAFCMSQCLFLRTALDLCLLSDELHLFQLHIILLLLKHAKKGLQILLENKAVLQFFDKVVDNS